MTKYMISIALTATALFAAGCLAASDDATETEDQALGATTAAVHLCVRQSTASANVTTNSNPAFAPAPCFGGTLAGASSQLSFGHPVSVIQGCFQSEYVFVRSLWNTNLYYVMRNDALGPC